MKTLIFTLLFFTAPFNTYAQNIAAPASTQSAQNLVDAAMKRVPQIDTAGLVAQLKAQPPTVVIDVRNPDELLGG